MSEYGAIEVSSGTKYAPRGVWRDWAIDVLPGAHSFREVRSAMLEMGYWLAENDGYRGLVLLVGSRITGTSLEQEADHLGTVLRPDFHARLRLLSIPDRDHLESVADRLDLAGGDRTGFLNSLERLVSEGTRHRKPREAFDLVFEVLLNQWMLQAEPMTIKWIMEATGFSYPPVAKALERLGPAVRRHADRSVELAYFPQDEWSRYLAAAERSGLAYRYCAEPEVARSADAMLERLQRKPYPGLAVGGVHAARRYDPDLDLVGSPRLDLCLHAPRGAVDLDFVQALDPALRREESAETRPPVLVVWPVYRDHSLFLENPGGIPWADPVNCLLVLQDTGLEPQAEAFLRKFTDRRKTDG